jgi:hypothetical protein
MGYLAVVALSIPFVPRHYIYYLIMTTHITYFSFMGIVFITQAFFFRPTEYGTIVTVINGLFSSGWWMFWIAITSCSSKPYLSLTSL